MHRTGRDEVRKPGRGETRDASIARPSALASVIAASIVPLSIACTAESDEDTSRARASALSAPSSLSAAPMGAGIHLTWRDNSADEAEFEIERREGASAPFQKIAAVPFDVAQHHDTSVMASRAYAYRVRAVATGTARSGYSNEVTVTSPATATGTPPPGAPPAPSTGWDGGAVSFAQHVVPLFQRSCGAGSTSCHARDAYGATSSRDCRGWLSLENAPLGSSFYGGTLDGQPTGCPDRSLHARLTELDAWQEPGGKRRRYVKAGDPDGSYLFNKIAGGPYADDRPGVASLPMPVSRALGASDVAMVRRWIRDGAADN